ncbi:MAG: hypothetical protein ACOX7K_09085, partial [Oscillospiraceae bacterium]
KEEFTRSIADNQPKERVEVLEGMEHDKRGTGTSDTRRRTGSDDGTERKENNGEYWSFRKFMAHVD